MLLNTIGEVFAYENTDGLSFISNVTTSVPLYFIYIHNDLKNGSLLNPDNLLAKFPDNQLDFELRPDIFYKTDSLSLALKPRFVSEIIEPATTEQRTGADSWVNEGHIRYSLQDSLFLGISRENIQWGPSMLVSLSNPFFLDNGRTNPYREIGGRDFVKLVKTFGSQWSLTLFDNFSQGSDDFQLDDLEDIIAIKMDYFGSSSETSFILSSAETEKLGGYFKYVANDALMLYTEWELEKGSNGFFPVESSGYFSHEMKQIYIRDDKLFFSILAGASYTTRDGATIYFEQIYNDTGYENDELSAFFSLARNTSAEIESAGGTVPEALQQLFLMNFNRLRLIGRNYLFVQYLKPDVNDSFDLALRMTVNNQDKSSQLVASVDYDYSDSIRFFMLGIFNHGEADSDFGRYLDSIIYAGATVYLF